LLLYIVIVIVIVINIIAIDNLQATKSNTFQKS